MDPVTKDGKMREQIQVEHQVRRKYAKKWADVSSASQTEFYNPNKVNEQLASVPSQELAPFVHTGHGDSHFISKDMYDSLLAVCRCGRPKREGHLLKCLQAAKPPPDNYEEFRKQNKLPKTSLGMYGWPHNRYAQMELNARYISPTYDIPGGRISAHPYSNVFIG